MTGAEAEGIDDLWALLERSDLLEVVERVCEGPDPVQVAERLAALARYAYSVRKNVSASVAFARAGLQYCLCYAGDPGVRQALRKKAKALSYNIAADTWPGWGDDGITSTSSDLEAGLDAARVNLRLVRELESGALAESIAHWALGAHRLARTEHATARADFQRARDLAHDAGNSDHERLNAGYIALVGTLQGDLDAHTDLVTIVQVLEAPTSSPDAQAFAEQLAKALEIFRAQLANGVAH